MKQQIITYWQSLKEQEQRLLIVAGVVFVLFALIMGVIRPINEALAEAQQKRDRNEELVNWVSQSVGQLKSAARQSVSQGGNLTQVVNQTRNRYQVQISKMQPNQNALRLTIDSVEFNRLISWLDELESRYAVNVVNLDIAQGDLPGMVRVSRLVLEK